MVASRRCPVTQGRRWQIVAPCFTAPPPEGAIPLIFRSIQFVPGSCFQPPLDCGAASDFGQLWAEGENPPSIHVG